MDTEYTIGSLARAAEVPTSTVRYYERAGLLVPEGRSGGNYRSYSARSLERLRFIRAAQANGFTLDDVKQLLRFQDGALAPCGEVQSLIEARLRDLEERMQQLRKVRTVLRASLEVCRRGEPSGRCEILEGLAHGKPAARRWRPRRGGNARPT
jgi:MerR family mercuric resistance operon transcriptional regulator